MFVDASAIAAVLLSEPEAGQIGAAIDGATEPFTSPLAAFEAVLAVTRASRLSLPAARRVVRAFLVRSGVEVRPVDDRVGEIALDAHERYGRGRGHSAKLNFGDCFSYAMAKAAGVGLLYKGEDFAQTDLA